MCSNNFDFPYLHFNFFFLFNIQTIFLILCFSHRHGRIKPNDRNVSVDASSVKNPVIFCVSDELTVNAGH